MNEFFQSKKNMTCSKLFSGDLPEISSYIIQNLRNNVSTLYSLALVNRFWCRLAIPLLWEDPFSVKYRENLPSHFIDIYFLFLSDNDKSKMETKFYSKFDSNLHKPLFNYPSLIKTVNSYKISSHVRNWLSITSVQQSSEELEVCTTLLGLFMENDASLNNLYISDTLPYDMMLNHPKFISKIENFSFHHQHCSVERLISTQTFLSSLTSLLSNSIKHINLYANNARFENVFSKIIQSQTHLSSAAFGFPKILDLLKHSSNTLTSIKFYSCHFSNIMRFDALSYLTQLESLQFEYCRGINSNVIQPLLSITTPLKIKTFVFFDNENTNLIEKLTPIQLLIQTIGSYIENLVLSICDKELRRKIFDVIIDSCEKIKFLYLSYIDLENISQISKMIFNFNNYLKYLTLSLGYRFYSCRRNIRHDDNLKLSSMILSELSKSSLSLHYLDLMLTINPDELQIALENCKQVKKLLIRNCSWNNIDTTLKVIKDFVKEKKPKFLAYHIEKDFLFPEVRVEYHKSLENFIEETQSFTKMVKYDDLVIRISETDGNLIIN